MTTQYNTGQNRTRQDRTRQDKKGQDRTGQERERKERGKREELDTYACLFLSVDIFVCFLVHFFPRRSHIQALLTAEAALPPITLALDMILQDDTRLEMLYSLIFS